jgi:hypothetical protein
MYFILSHVQSLASCVPDIHSYNPLSSFTGSNSFFFSFYYLAEETRTMRLVLHYPEKMLSLGLFKDSQYESVKIGFI